MDKQIELILSYQEVDKELKALEDELYKNEDTQKYFSAKKFLNTVNETLQGLESKAKTIVDSYNFSLNEVKKLQEEASVYTQSVQSCESEEELNYYKQKYQSVCDLIANAENKANTLYKEMDALLKEFNLLRGKTKEMKVQFEECGPKAKVFADSQKAKKQELQAKLDEIQKDIDEELMQKYLSRRKDKKFPIVYGVDASKNNCYCPSCATGMSISAISNLASGGIKECESCRKLLYAIQPKK